MESNCPRCAQPGTQGHICGRCQTRNPAFDATIAAFAYDEPVSSLICRLKYGGDLSAARLLGQLLAERIAACEPQARPELIVPVPLHPRRIMKRGFNQSIEIGKVVAKQLNIPMATSLARRLRHTAAQQALTLDRRRHNVRDSFELQHAPDVRRVALIDDVMTSGATLDALADCFKQRGNYEVHCWVCARA
jgi:ComF family protein